MQMFKERVNNLTGIKLQPHQLEAFALYAQEIIAWNKKFNLTSIFDLEAIYTKHFLDSLSCLLVIDPLNALNVVDIGSGAGFPGIPLKITLPNLYLTIVESNRKKASFCEMIAKKLNLRDVMIQNQRVEIIGQEMNFRESYDWAIARAVAHLSTLTEYMLPLVKLGGKALAMKAKKTQQEIADAKYAIQVLGGKIENTFPVNIPGLSEKRYLVSIAKLKHTPKKYPRRTGVPVKKPLSA